MLFPRALVAATALAPAAFGIANGTYYEDGRTDLSSPVVHIAPRGTGTFLNETTLLTSAHVVAPTGEGTRVSVIGGSPPGRIGSVRSVNVFVPSEYPKEIYKTGGWTDPKIPPHWADISLVVFPPGTASEMGVKAVYGVAEHDAVLPSTVTLFGFSAVSTKSKEEERRGGTATGARIVDDYLESVGFNTNQGMRGEPNGIGVTLERGDSGGPTFDATTKRILGVHAKSDYLTKNGDVDLRARWVKAFFKRAILCDKPPCAENFPGSGVDEKEKAVAKFPNPVEERNALFCHNAEGGWKIGYWPKKGNARLGNGTPNGSCLHEKICPEYVKAERKGYVCSCDGSLKTGIFRLSDGRRMAGGFDATFPEYLFDAKKDACLKELESKY